MCVCVCVCVCVDTWLKKEFYLQNLGIKFTGRCFFVWVVWAPKIDKETCRLNLREDPKPEVRMEKDQGMLVS